MTTGDVGALLDCHSQPLTDANLEDLTKSASEEEEETQQVVDQSGLTLERLAKLCNLAKELKEGSREWEQRYGSFCAILQQGRRSHESLQDAL
ncbi:Hypothetical predicted protein [Octopus vulgaris]|uniref:Uncharacterized protein n=1 Tax=Octopus vulgaris TaxID=6645 RepID=A0AA36BA33_OCTVU|nr:Hypothetical predicted protein [Octopus vulgaris]